MVLSWNIQLWLRRVVTSHDTISSSLRMYTYGFVDATARGFARVKKLSGDVNAVLCFATQHHYEMSTNNNERCDHDEQKSNCDSHQIIAGVGVNRHLCEMTHDCICTRCACGNCLCETCSYTGQKLFYHFTAYPFFLLCILHLYYSVNTYFFSGIWLW